MAIVTTSVDSWVNQSQATANYGSAVRLWVNGGAGSDNRFSYIHFTRPFPLGATVLAASLKIYLRGTWSGSHTLTAERITQSWAEARINYNNRPNTTSVNSATANVTDGVARQEVEFDITDMLQAVSDGAAWYGVAISSSVNANREFHSSEATDATMRPVLEVEWSEAPEAPTNLAPAGDRAVSKDEPLFTWRFIDRLGDTTQASSQLQVDSDDAFGSPILDTTKIANTESAYDSVDDALNLSDNTQYFWRVKVWDGTDLESDWSDTVSFYRQTHGSLVIDNPAADPDDIVTETTPPISWTFSDRTQEAYQVLLYKVLASGSTVTLWDSGRTVSTDDTVSVPAGKITSYDDDYRVTVRIWDTIDRQAMAGDLDYVEASRDFTFEPEGTPDAVTSFTAVADGPAVDLAWERSAQPDYFALMVDGEIVEDRIEPTDIFVSGTAYAMTYWGAQPRVEHEYEVISVVDDPPFGLSHSDSNPTALVTTRPIGIYLVDPVDDTSVFIAGKEGASLGIGETAETFLLAGSRIPVRITDSVRGYEGEIQGILLSKTDRDTFLTLKGRLKTLRLIIGDLNIPVVLEGASAIPTPNPGDNDFGVAFGVLQVDEFPLDVAGD